MNLRRIDPIKLVLIASFLLISGCATSPIISGTADVNACFDVPSHKKPKLILFIHGINGDGRGTWTYNGKTQDGKGDISVYWPDLIEGDNDPGSIEYSRDFDVSSVYFESNNYVGITEVAEKLLTCWQSNKVSQYKEVFIVCHSMGGLIAKEMLLQMKMGSGVPENIKALITIATPQNGARIAEIAQGLHLGPFLGARFLADMEPNSPFLTEFLKQWPRFLAWRKFGDKTNCRIPLMYAAREEKPEANIMYAVRDEEANTYIDDGELVTVDGSHIDCVKPADRRAFVYQWVKTKILATTDQDLGFCGIQAPVNLASDPRYSDSESEVIQKTSIAKKKRRKSGNGTGGSQ
jgi:hypothetical protein